MNLHSIVPDSIVPEAAPRTLPHGAGLPPARRSGRS